MPKRVGHVTLCPWSGLDRQEPPVCSARELEASAKVTLGLAIGLGPSFTLGWHRVRAKFHAWSLSLHGLRLDGLRLDGLGHLLTHGGDVTAPHRQRTRLVFKPTTANLHCNTTLTPCNSLEGCL